MTGPAEGAGEGAAARSRALPVIAPERWYETLPFGEGVTLLGEPWLPPQVRCNMWIVEGRDRTLLIDAGLGAVPMRAHVPLLNGRPVTLLLSHSHFDHIGMAHEFEDRLAHPAEADILARPDNAATLADLYVRPGRERDIALGLPPGFSAADYRIEPAPATRLVGEGERIDLGGRVLTVLHTPGHSPGHLSLFEERTGILFSQDAVYDGRLIDDCYHSDVADYVETMERLARLRPRIVHPGHFGSFGPTRFAQLIERYLRSKDG